MPANKVKGLLKGLRYISQVFDNEKEPEMEIGHPTDVKHVAHIGCDGSDGQSGNPPAWMREFGPPPSYSGPLTDDGEISQNGSAKWSSEDLSSNQRSARPPAPLDIPEKPRSSRRSSLPSNASNRIDSPKKSKSSDKSKTSRRSNSSTQTKESSPGSSESPARSNMSEKLPKKSRRKKTTKEGGGRGGGGGGSVRTSSSSSSRSKGECCEGSYACPIFSDPGPRNDDLPPLRSPLKSYGGGEHNGYF